MDVMLFQYVEDREIMSKENLAQAYLDYVDGGMQNGNTWDDFFDHVNIPKEDRTDFAATVILKQAMEIVAKED